jgi:hypothetical protein
MGGDSRADFARMVERTKHVQEARADRNAERARYNV